LEKIVNSDDFFERVGFFIQFKHEYKDLHENCRRSRLFSDPPKLDALSGPVDE
jgi:hypothetical protein